MVENDCEDQGFSSMANGCNVCPPKRWENSKRVNHAIVPRGQWMCCERCGGSYGEVPKEGAPALEPEPQPDDGMPECFVHVGHYITIDVRQLYREQGFQQFPPTITVPGNILIALAQLDPFYRLERAGSAWRDGEEVLPHHGVIVKNGDRFLQVPPAA